MALKETFQLYDNVKDDLKFFIASDVRTKIIISLMAGSKKLGQLRRELDLSSSTILHGIYQLEEKNIVFRESGRYYLSQTGIIAANKLLDISMSIYAINKSQDLFLHHEIGCIPPKLLLDVRCLKDAVIIKSSPTNILKPHTMLTRLMNKTKNVKHLSSVYFPQNTELFHKKLGKNGRIHLLITQKILDKLIKTSDLKKFREASNKFKLGIIDDNTQLSLTLGDNFMALGLFSTDGMYDLNTYLVSEDDQALVWGNRLFKYYQKTSKAYPDES